MTAHNERDDRRPSIVVAGGHSAGHIEPALNTADAIRELAPRAQITALGTERGLDTTLIPARGYSLRLIPPVPLSRHLDSRLLNLPRNLRASVRAAGAVLEDVRADVLVGFGGYVAAPAYLAARRHKVPIVVHEANARAGIANRLGARLTSYVFTASPTVRINHATPIGIPLRPAIANLDRQSSRAQARQRFGLDQALPTLLVTGGSQGAQRLNAAVLGAADRLAAAGIQVLHISGGKNPVTGPARAAGEPPYVVLGFLDDMASGYAAADFALCRSGAMTCAELTAVGLPAAYVPLPLRGGEQGLNAEPIVAGGGGVMVADDACTADWVTETVSAILGDAARLAAMTTAASRAGSREAGHVLARSVLEVARGRN
jgi:UDP-N-acetylglucosamine--N-acetylmuramyl-(pentapeptide) pyrophosphoryl-undecaprenol N-acetylglucosamine transferase